MLRLQGDVDFFWGQQLYWMGETSICLDYLRSAIERIPVNYHVARGEAELFWSLAHQATGQLEKAVQWTNQWLYYGETPQPARAFRLMGALIFIYILSGNLTRANQIAQTFLEEAVENKNSYAVAWACYLLGNVHYCWGRLDEATEYFSRAVENRYVLHSRAAVDALVGLSLAYQGSRQFDKVKETVNLLLEFADETTDPAYKMIAHSCQARLALQQGDMVFAERWLQTTAISPDTTLMFYWLEIPQITICRVMIAQGSESNLHLAAERLQEYWRLAKDQFNTRRMIDISILQSTLNHKLGQSDAAINDLKRAISLAEPGNYIRPFAEVGSDLTPVFAQLVKVEGVTDYVSRLLQACEITIDTGERRTTPSPLVDPLTNREYEILELLEERLTNKEIAAKLHISVGTVQQHLNHIYSKMNVKGRRQAIDKAIELALLPTHQ
jgi:LuxR family maltose regulon positive regulatory protein